MYADIEGTVSCAILICVYCDKWLPIFLVHNFFLGMDFFSPNIIRYCMKISFLFDIQIISKYILAVIDFLRNRILLVIIRNHFIIVVSSGF